MDVDQTVDAFPQPGSFHHQPLDHSKPSIRFIKLLPKLTSDGRIRCEVSHTTTGSEIVYRCLSYQWGEPNAATSREIELNGARFTVRKNLYHFLYILWSNMGYNTILGTWAGGVWWIDAICIDQRNTFERNHQVAHMGTIYSEAEEVVVWLGLADIAKNKVRNLLDLAPSGGKAGGMESSERGGTYFHDRRIIGRRIIRNDYWNRAWITQEIALAQSVSVLVDDLLYGFPELVDLLSLLDIPWRHTHLDQFVGIRNGTIDLSKHSLVDLLDYFQNRKCTLPQDRVFSLLSLCSDVNGSIRVDYNMSKDQLANQILNPTMTSQNSLREACICSGTVVARSLGMQFQPKICQEPTPELSGCHPGTYLEFQVVNLFIRPLDYNRSTRTRTLTLLTGYESDEFQALYRTQAASGISDTATMCQTRGMEIVKQALQNNVQLATHHLERWNDSWFGQVELSRIMNSFISKSQQFATSTTCSEVEIAPGCRIEVQNQKANVCLVRIAFRALPDLFNDVTGLCDDPGHLTCDEQGPLRHMRVVYVPPKSNA